MFSSASAARLTIGGVAYRPHVWQQSLAAATGFPAVGGMIFVASPEPNANGPATTVYGFAESLSWYDPASHFRKGVFERGHVYVTALDPQYDPADPDPDHPSGGYMWSETSQERFVAPVFVRQPHVLANQFPADENDPAYEQRLQNRYCQFVNGRLAAANPYTPEQTQNPAAGWGYGESVVADQYGGLADADDADIPQPRVLGTDPGGSPLFKLYPALPDMVPPEVTYNWFSGIPIFIKAVPTREGYWTHAKLPDDEGETGKKYVLKGIVGPYAGNIAGDRVVYWEEDILDPGPGGGDTIVDGEDVG